MMCEVLGGIYQGKLTLFLSRDNVNKCGKTYKAAYSFFEKFRTWRARTRVRIEDRVKNETENPIGFHQCAEDLIELIEAVENVSTDDFVHDTYPQVIVKLKDFLARDGVTQAMMCKVLGGIYHEKLTLFLSGENVYKGNEM